MSEKQCGVAEQIEMSFAVLWRAAGGDVRERALVRRGWAAELTVPGQKTVHVPRTQDLTGA